MVEWRPVPGFSLYEVSDEAQVRRRAVKQFGPQNRNPLKHVKHHTGYLQVTIRTDEGRGKSMYVHQLVARAFHGMPERGQQVRHLDGNSTNNVPGNLAWGTTSENTLDQVRHGTHRSITRRVSTHCSRGHEMTGDNVTFRASGRRECRMCRKERWAEYVAKKRVEEGDM